MEDGHERFGFEIALARMKAGKTVARLGWQRINHFRRKVRVGLSPSGGIRTWFLNYYSDRGVITTDDILATDWTDAER